jgi:hypothetical protein
MGQIGISYKNAFSHTKLNKENIQFFISQETIFFLSILVIENSKNFNQNKPSPEIRIPSPFIWGNMQHIAFEHEHVSQKFNKVDIICLIYRGDHFVFLDFSNHLREMAFVLKCNKVESCVLCVQTSFVLRRFRRFKDESPFQRA